MLRYNLPYDGMRYIGDKDSKLIHDLDNESSLCYINNISEEKIIMLESEDDVQILCETENYRGCHWCNSRFDADLTIC